MACRLHHRFNKAIAWLRSIALERRTDAIGDQVPVPKPDRRTFYDEYKLLVQAITDCAIFRIDSHGFVASWNPGAEKIKGYTASEAVGLHFSCFFTPEDQKRDWPAIALGRARETGRFQEEGWRIRKDGSRFWANVIIDAIRDESGAFQGFAKVTHDISDKHAVQEALNSSERRFRLMMDNLVHHAIYTLDVGGYVTSWNRDAEHAKGYTKAEILGAHFSLFYTAEDQANGKPAIALRLAQEAGRFEEEGWRVRKDGTCFWASVVLDPMRDESNQLVGFAKITRDISEKRLLEEAREQLY